METISHQQLISSRKELDSLLIDLGLPVIQSDRLHLAYKILEDFEQVRLDPVKSIEFLRRYNQKAELHFAIFDIDALQHFWLFAKEINKDVLREKLKLILSGSSPIEANPTNTVPRDTLFELQLFAHFKRAGLDARLCMPNPDIEVHVNGRIYNVQCKRIYKPERSTVKNAIHKAFKQLDADSRRNPGSLGVVALSIENFYTAGGKALITETIQDALNNLSMNLNIFFKTFEALWHNPTKIRNLDTVALIAYITALTITKSNRLQSTGNYFGFTNTYQPADAKFHQFIEDFESLSKLADVRRRFEQ